MRATASLVAAAFVALLSLSSGAPPVDAATSLPPNGDAYIRSDEPTRAFGARHELRAGVRDGGQFRSLLRFDLSGLTGSVSSAELKLYPSQGTPSDVTVARPATGSWTENEVTWANAPAVGTTIGALRGSSPTQRWFSIDLDPAAVPTGRTSSVMLLSNADMVRYGSRGSSTPPALEVRLSTGSTATIAPTQAPTTGPTPSPTPTPTPTSVTYTWQDEFNGTSLDTTKWRASNYGVTGGGRRCCGTNHANYADEVSVSDGYLHLGATKVGSLWHTGTIDTETKRTFQYGIWEARIKLPRGLGFWPAFWGYANSGEEIDVLEVCAGPVGSRGGNDVTMAHQGIHRYNDSPRAARDTDMGVDLSSGFHTYAVEWRSGYIRFSIDGVQRGADITPSLSDPMPLILNFGVGGTWCGEPDSSTPTSAEMLVDWVRVRQ